MSSSSSDSDSDVPVGPGQTPKPKKKPPPTPFAKKPFKAFYYFFIANLVAASFAPIQDCDETFNYWEPMHYLSHGYGLQTWEYSPEYAIRSWAYIGLHAIAANFRRLLPRPNKVAEFYFLRYVLALVCTLCQTRLFIVLNNSINPRIAFFFLIVMVVSPGMFHASAAFLPSSFTMYTGMLGMASFVSWKGGLKTAQGIFWFAVGGVLGWPFALALAIPFIIEELVLATLSDKSAIVDCITRFTKGAGGALCVVVGEVLVSSFFYQKLELVPLNIVLYNVFSGEGQGPDIYGTEPWHFYIRNLILNFNIWFVLAVAALPLYVLQKLFFKQREGIQSGLRTVLIMSPFYLWLTIFSLQPHKEERFMYPAYPFLAVNAAFALHVLLSTFGNPDPRSLPGKIPAHIKLLVVVSVLALSVNLGASRIYGVWSGYHAPLSIYEPLQKEGLEAIAFPGDTVCLGKEWYRFPTSYFLPQGVKAKFIKSEFDGLLPGEFAEATGFASWPGTWQVPEGMNSINKEDPGKHVPIDTCTFLVDSYFPGSDASEKEPHYVLDNVNWEEIKCEPFLDASRTHILARTVWIPNLPFIPQKYQRHWGRHCLLKRKDLV